MGNKTVQLENKVQETLPLYTIKKNHSDFFATKITSSKDAADLIRTFYSDDIGIFESVFILCLNNSNKTVGYAKISQGGVTGTVIDVKIIAKYCIDNLATGCIIAHNHPSGVLTPSGADKEITKKIISALPLVDCKLLDHVILTEESYYSFADEGILY